MWGIVSRVPWETGYFLRADTIRAYIPIRNGIIIVKGAGCGRI
jgi:hypothetical protein